MALIGRLALYPRSAAHVAQDALLVLYTSEFELIDDLLVCDVVFE